MTSLKHKPFNFLKIVSYVDIHFFLETLLAKPFLWREFSERQDYPGSPHHDTRSIFLRWAQTETPVAVFTEIPAVNYPAFQHFPGLKEFLSNLMAMTGAVDLGRVMLTELKPGGVIDPHYDAGAYADYYERFHIPIFSAPGNLFFSGEPAKHGEFVHMEDGELWCFNHHKTHWFYNGSKVPRIHLIVDMAAPEFRQ